MSSKKPADIEVQVRESDSRDTPDSKTLIEDWDAPHNTENPRNWSAFKKARHIIPVALLCLSVTAGSSMITPGTFAIAYKFQVSHTAALLPLSLFVLGLAMGPMLAAPISETRGRSIVYKASMPLYMLFILGAGLSESFAGLLVCRFLAAMSGAPCLAVGAGTVADLFEPTRMAAPGAIVVMAPFLGPCKYYDNPQAGSNVNKLLLAGLGPVIGGFSATYTEYRWTQWSTIFLALFAYILVLPTQETHRKVLLKRKAQQLNLPPPEPELAPKEAVKMLLTIVLIRPIRMLASEPIVLLYSIYNAFTFSVLFAFFEAYPYYFMGEYGFEIWQSGLTFLGVGLGVLLGAVGAILVDLLVYQKIVREGGDRIKNKGPEQRLYIGMIGDLFLPIGLVWFALSAKTSIHWIVPVLAGVPFAFGNVTVFISAALYMLDVYGPLSGASAMAANGLMRYTMGAAFPLFTVQMYEKLGVKWATLLLAFVCMLMVPIPWVFYKFGPGIRKKSALAQ
ncbi:Polyamine transporter [Lachnellula suecica]|uniref:Polyamine transporter n=1 Tax=Lachnellula suecica TaxID=602035 RepID=A0A8T9CFM8_9HELO|nr:Polyamine transporter [Lachnellula suecica]